MLNDSKALKLILLSAFIVAALISLSIRLSWSHNQKEADFAASSSTSVTINAVDSAISVRRSEDGRVHARLAHSSKMSATEKGNEIIIDVAKTNGLGRLEVTLPPELSAITVKNVSGRTEIASAKADRISISNVSSSIELLSSEARAIDIVAVSGSVEAKDVKGSDISIKTVSGEIEAYGIESDSIRLETVSGSVYADAAFSSLDASSKSGEIEIDGEGGYEAEWKTTSGSVEIDGRTVAKSGKEKIGEGDGRADITTISGSIELR